MNDGKQLAYIAMKNKIQAVISSGIYKDLDEFFADTPDFATFQIRSHMNNTIRRACNFQLDEEDYQQIIIELRAELEEKLRIDHDNITTVNVNGQEIATYKDDDKIIVINNTYADKSVDAQLGDLQDKYVKFREPDATMDMMKYLQDEIKPVPEFTTLPNVDTSSLSSDEQEVAEVAEAYQKESEGIIKVDFANRLLMDGDGQVLPIEERDGTYDVYTPDTVESNEVSKTKGAQKRKVKPKPHLKQAGISSAIAMALLSGLFMGIIFLSLFR